MTPEEKLVNLRELATLVNYDPETGIVTYKSSNKEVGCKCYRTDGRKNGIQKQYKGKKIYVHQLIWVIVYDKLPEYVIDHKNGDPWDNRIENLRDVTSSDNAKNAKLRKDNTTGVSGVSFSKKRNRFVANIWVDTNRKHIGNFVHLHDAETAIKKARAELGFSERHGT